MKKLLSLLILLFLVTILIGCGDDVTKEKTINGNMKTYYLISDGSWSCEGYSYKDRLEISGKMPNAAVDSTFVYLSNLEDITFEQAWKAAGFSSSSEDYFSTEDAVLVEIRTD